MGPPTLGRATVLSLGGSQLRQEGDLQGSKGMRRVDAVELCSEQGYRTSDRIGKKRVIHRFPHLGQVCARWAGPVGEADQGERHPLPGLE